MVKIIKGTEHPEEFQPMNKKVKAVKEIQSLLSGSIKGAVFYNGKWLIGQDCHLEIPEQRKLDKEICQLQKIKLPENPHFAYPEIRIYDEALQQVKELNDMEVEDANR